MISEAQRAQRRKAGKRSGESRGGREDQEPAGDPNAPMPSSDPEVDAILAAYTEMAGKPQSWPDIKNCEQVRAEIYKTRAAARQDQLDAKRLLTRDQVRARDETKVELFRSALMSAIDLVAKWVPPDKILAAQSAFREWADQTLEHIANDVKK